MFWRSTINNTNYISWGKIKNAPPSTPSEPLFDIHTYGGEPIEPEDSVIFTMQGSADLGLGDSIWLLSYMRDIYRIKARRRCQFILCSSPWILNFYSNFIPKSFIKKEEHIAEKEFNQITHKLPAMYYWHEFSSKKTRTEHEYGADKSWTDNQSLISRLYKWTGMQYNGLPDWGEFTNEELLYPPDSFYQKLNLNKKDKYVFFQWHSSGHSKNLSPAANIKLLTHITKNYGYKAYVIGRLKCLDQIESIPGVINLSGKTEGNVGALFTLAFNAEFIVGPDSAAIHLAEAYKIPAVGIMGTLPPVYIAKNYKIPTFMFGSGECPHKPCGVVHMLPRDKCPPETKDYCNVLTDVNLKIFDRCVKESFDKRLKYRSTPSRNFYNAMEEPISLCN